MRFSDDTRAAAPAPIILNWKVIGQCLPRHRRLEFLIPGATALPGEAAVKSEIDFIVGLISDVPVDYKMPGILGTIKFRVGLTLVLTLVGAGTVLLFWYFKDIREPLTYAMAVVASLAVVSSAYYVAATLAISVHRDKVHRSFEFTRQLNDVNLVELRVFLTRELDIQKLTPGEFYQKVISTDKTYSAVKCLLGIFEDASIAVQCDYVDERTLFSSLSYLVPWAAENFAPYVKEQRRLSGSVALYAELDRLTSAWKDKKSLKTGELL